MNRIARILSTAVLAAALPAAGAAASGDVLPERPDATADLRASEGAALVKAVWRVRQAEITTVDHRSVGPDLKATGAANRTNDLAPLAGAAEFDDSAWEVVRPEDLERRQGTGKLTFVWYRTRVTIPEKLGALPTAGTTVALEIVMDDYAEVWVDGKLPLGIGQSGGAAAAGWNAPNRLVLTRDARPGRTFTIAVLGVNAPLSAPPATYIWMRTAALDFYKPERARVGRDAPTEIVRLDPALDAIVPAGARIEKLAEGFGFTEGPAWSPEGDLFFSDPNLNRIHRWTADGRVFTVRSHSGYAGVDIGEYGQPGSNGLAFDAEGRLTVCEHGNRRVTRTEKNGVITVLADRYEGRRLNSPNDLVYKSDGSLYFSDPPFGLPRFHDDPRREQPHFGVYRVAGGAVTLASKELRGPNGLAFSPDERRLYVTNWDEKKKVVMRYDVRPDGALENGTVFLDLKDAPEPEALDGVKVDRMGNVYVSGPGGLWIVSPEGKRLGVLRGPELPANFAWGDADRRTLYLTARTGLYRIRLNVPGAGAFPGS